MSMDSLRSHPLRTARALPSLWAAVLLLHGGVSRAADVVGRIGSIEVTSGEIRAYVESLPAQDQAALARDPALLSQVVRTYLARQAVLHEAQSKKYDQQPSVKGQLDRVRDEALTELYLQSVSRPPEGFPSEAEVRAAYDANPRAFQTPRQWRVAQIFVARPADKDAEEKARRKAEEIGRQARQKGADFASLARLSSEEKDSANRGGEIGWLAEDQMVPGVRSVVTALGKDAVSEPVRLDDGWHVLKLLDSKPAAIRPLSEVREAIVAQLRTERARANRQAYLGKLLEQNPPAINELGLSKVLARGK
ncbi:MAG TPA: peptidylprolyl isomerase [Myxococcaceae bacterium]|nr:peptidylprolyl isomerase [Myxococcaceae bacterium]